jgi:hypothetical protein
VTATQASEVLGQISLIASDLVDFLPAAFLSLADHKSDKR